MVTSATPRLGQRLGALRDKYFVGRSAELDLFRSALRGDHPLSLLHVHGPGGVGKSVLLREFGRAAAASGASVATLDGRDIEPSPASFLRAMRLGLGLEEDQQPLEALANAKKPVVLIDTYEVLAPLDVWLREHLLPQLPDQALVVMAGRNPPAAAWRADPAWSELGHILPLRNLLPGDSRAYLQARGVPESQHARVVEFTHGHPLALSLLANLLVHEGARAFRPENAPDVVRTLLERFVERVPSQLHWQALAVCAHARVTTEPLLVDVVGAADAPALFAWLRDLPFVEQGPLGLFPHDVAREVLDADLRWRDPVTYRDLHTRIRDSIVKGLQASRVLEQQASYFDFLYLCRHGAISKAYYDWASFGHLYAEVARPDDHADIVGMVRRHEGDASAGIAEYWLARQPRAFVVFRQSSQEVAGFSAALNLGAVTADDMAADPAIANAWKFISQRGPLRPGETFMHHRFFVGRDAYQDLATHNMVAMVATLRWLTTPRLAWSFATVAELDHWRLMFEAIRFPHCADAEFMVGGHRYAVFAHDWRTDPVHQWIEVKTSLDPHDLSDGPDLLASPVLEVLSQPDFEAAVRQALRDFHRPTLAGNPLLRSRLVLEHARGAAPAVDTLKSLLHEAAGELRANPKTVKLYRAVACTYLEPAATQELAAERLGLPFNTYRYQLAASIKRIADALWQREVTAD